MLIRYRYAFVKEGTATEWIELPLKQAQAVARKIFKCNFALWNLLLKQNKIQIRSQKFINGYWLYQ